MSLSSADVPSAMLHDTGTVVSDGKTTLSLWEPVRPEKTVPKVTLGSPRYADSNKAHALCPAAWIVQPCFLHRPSSA